MQCLIQSRGQEFSSEGVLQGIYHTEEDGRAFYLSQELQESGLRSHDAGIF